MSDFLNSLVAGKPVLPRVRDAALEQEAKARRGMVSEMLYYVTGSPWIADVVMTGTGRSYAKADDLNLAEFAASQENGCRHCYGAMRAVMRMLGFSEAQIVSLEHDRRVAELGERGRAIIDFARALARSNPRPAHAELEELRRVGFSRHEAAELAIAIAFACLLNRISSFLAIPPDAAIEAMPKSLMVRLLGPLVRRKMRGKPLPPPAAPFPPPAVPLGALIPRLGPVHSAGHLGRTLEAAFRSDVLPRRAKTLVFAVVARAIGCGYCEREAAKALGEEGLDAAEAARILDHLASPSLDRTEALLVVYARETVRYRPAAMQERTRALLGELGPDRALEAVGIAALANAVVRLGMLAEC